MVGRLKPGVERLQAQAAVSTLFRNTLLHEAKPVAKAGDEPGVVLLPAQQGLTGNTTELSAPLYVLMMAVGVVLLIACANVAGLLLSRSAGRQKEIALRFALGARRGRVIRQLLTESVLLSVAGGVLGVLFAQWATTAITALFAANQDATFQAGIDGRVLLFTAAAAIFTGILFGFAPAMHGMRVDLTPALKETAGASAPGHRSGRWFTAANALVVAQVALTMIVLVAAGLLVRTLQNLKNVDPGFDTRNILTFRVDPKAIGYKRPDVQAFCRDLQERIGGVPGVTSVSYSWMPLLGGGLWTTSFNLPGKPREEQVDSDVLPIGESFLSTMRIPLRLGREFRTEDFAQAARISDAQEKEFENQADAVKNHITDLAERNKKIAAGLPPMPVLVNEAFVKKYFPGRNPIGIQYGAESADAAHPLEISGWGIVGVVRDARYNSLRRGVKPTMYIPATGQAATFSVRTAADPNSFLPQIRGIVKEMDSDLPLFNVRTETQQIERQLLGERLIARLSSFFGLLALVLACIGLYGLLSYEVTRRTREIGIRMALGAKAAEVFRLVIGQGIVLALVGAAIGIGASLGITRFLGSLLYDVKAADPVTFAGVGILLAVVAVLACYLPARRATRVDPLIALRYE
jgi:predicted permease